MTFDDLVSGGEIAIEGLIGEQETLQLEFKANDYRDPIFVDGALNKAGKRLLAKEASAFANSAGGIIVFGVDCRSVKGVDEAEKLTPIDDLRRAETTVREAAADLLQPKHDGIRVASIRTANDSNSGFVVVDVPRSERRPHRSEATEQKQYFKRAGSSSFPMEHYDIEDAFKRAASPSLRFVPTFDFAYATGSNQQQYYFVIALENVGETTAKMISVQLWDRIGEVFHPEYDHKSEVQISEYQKRMYLSGNMDLVIHPGETRAIHRFSLVVRNTPNGVTIGSQGRLFKPGAVTFKYALAADGMRMTSNQWVITDEDMIPFNGLFLRQHTGNF